MDDDFIVAVYVVIDETMAALGHRSHPLAVVSDAEVLTDTTETVFSQLAAMGIARLHVRSMAGLELKVHASLLALTCARAA